MNVEKSYQAYLLRFKRRESQSSWCATLEDVHTREILTFGTEWELLIYLLHSLSDHPGLPDTKTDTDSDSES